MYKDETLSDNQYNSHEVSKEHPLDGLENQKGNTVYNSASLQHQYSIRCDKSQGSRTSLQQCPPTVRDLSDCGSSPLYDPTLYWQNLMHIQSNTKKCSSEKEYLNSLFYKSRQQNDSCSESSQQKCLSLNLSCSNNSHSDSRIEVFPIHKNSHCLKPPSIDSQCLAAKNRVLNYSSLLKDSRHFRDKKRSNPPTHFQKNKMQGHSSVHQNSVEFLNKSKINSSLRLHCSQIESSNSQNSYGKQSVEAHSKSSEVVSKVVSLLHGRAFHYVDSSKVVKLYDSAHQSSLQDNLCILPSKYHETVDIQPGPRMMDGSEGNNQLITTNEDLNFNIPLPISHTNVNVNVENNNIKADLSDDSIDILDHEPNKKVPEVITLADDSDIEQESLTPPITATEHVHHKSAGLHNQLKALKTLQQSVPNRQMHGISSSSKKQNKNSSHRHSKQRHSKYRSRRSKKKITDRDKVEALFILESLDNKPPPGSIGELLLKNHTRHFVDRVIAPPKNNSSVPSVNIASTSPSSSCYNTDEEELMLRKEALQSVFQCLEKSDASSQPKVKVTVSPDVSHHPEVSVECNSMHFEVNKDPVDMDICDSEPEESSCTQENDELHEVGDNFSIPVEWAYMIPPPGPKHIVNDMINFESFSLEQNLCKQTMELSYLSTSPVKHYSGFFSNAIEEFNHPLLADNAATNNFEDLFPANLEGYAPEPLLPSANEMLVFNNIDHDAFGSNSDDHYAQTLSQVNANNQVAFMDVISKQRKSNNSNLIHVKIDHSEQPKKEQKRRKISNRKASYTNNQSASLVDDLPLVSQPSTVLDCDETVKLNSTTKVKVNTIVNIEEDEHSLRTRLLKAMLSKSASTEIIMPHVPSASSTSVSSKPTSKSGSNASTSFIHCTATKKRSSLKGRAFSSKAKDNVTANMDNAEAASVKASKMVFRYPKPIIINLNDDSDSSNDASDQSSAPSSNSQVIDSLCGSFLRGIRHGVESNQVCNENIEKTAESNHTPKVSFVDICNQVFYSMNFNAFTGCFPMCDKLT